MVFKISTEFKTGCALFMTPKVAYDSTDFQFGRTLLVRLVIIDNKQWLAAFKKKFVANQYDTCHLDPYGYLEVLYDSNNWIRAGYRLISVQEDTRFRKLTKAELTLWKLRVPTL